MKLAAPGTITTDSLTAHGREGAILAQAVRRNVNLPRTGGSRDRACWVIALGDVRTKSNDDLYRIAMTTLRGPDSGLAVEEGGVFTHPSLQTERDARLALQAVAAAVEDWERARAELDASVGRRIMAALDQSQPSLLDGLTEAERPKGALERGGYLSEPERPMGLDGAARPDERGPLRCPHGVPVAGDRVCAKCVADGL